MNLAYQTTEQERLLYLEGVITHHPAWHGNLSGMDCEQILREYFPRSYLLRAGEEKFHYYLSFVDQSRLNFKHQPFMIDCVHREWIYRNGNIHHSENLEDIITAILHCTMNECLPILKTGFM